MVRSIQDTPEADESKIDTLSTIKLTQNVKGAG